MYLTIVNKETQEEIDKFRTREWFEAVQYVEQNKEKYREAGCLSVTILNKRAKLACDWNLTEEIRPLILKDKAFVEKPTILKVR